MPTTTVTSHDAELIVHDHGTGDPLVLVHGYTGSSLDFADVGPMLADAAGVRVVTFDHRGHGDSTNTGDAATYTFDQMADDLRAVVDALGLDRFDLLGHSMGGVVAQRFVHGGHAARVRSLVLMDTSARPMGMFPVDMLEGLAEVGKTEGMDVLHERIAPFMTAGRERWPEANRDVLAARGTEKFVNMDPVAFATLGRALTEYESMVDELAGLDMPVTVIVGEHDEGLRDAADEMATVAKDAVLEVVAEAGHCPNEDRPDEWVRILRDHLTRARA